MARILILSASVGAGHTRAAQAIEAALRETVPEATVRHVDVLELTNAAFRRIYGRAYLDLVNHAPHVLGYIYDMMDQPPATPRRGDKLRLLVEKLNLGKFIRFLRMESWDLVLNTHFLPAEIIAHLRQQGSSNLTQLTVTTDFETHRLWVNEPCEHYYTATEEGARYLHYWGVPAEHTTVTGIPIDPVFARPKDRVELTRKHGLLGDRPVVLQLAGGFGVGPIEHLHRSILQAEHPIELVVITGRNEQAREKLREVSVPARHRVKVVGFTTEMDEWLAMADLVVSKPGGLTTSETLARGAVMVVVNPIPGQEYRNSDYLLEKQAAIKASTIPTIAFKINELLTDEERLRRLKSNARAIGRPRAAYTVAEHALRFLPADKSIDRLASTRSASGAKQSSLA